MFCTLADANLYLSRLTSAFLTWHSIRQPADDLPFPTTPAAEQPVQFYLFKPQSAIGAHLGLDHVVIIGGVH